MLKFDLFSSEFYFNLGSQDFKKNSLQGVFLSFMSVFIIVSYFIYLVILYATNQIDPKFRQQSFIMNEKLEIPFSQDLLGFTFQLNATLTVDQIQANSNVTYLVYYAQYYYSDPISNFEQYINLDVVKCTDPQLQGLNCVDFSKLSNNYTLLLDTNKQIISQLQISLYGCRDLDEVKTTIPPNCAEQQDIDNIVSSLYGQFFLKLRSQQYNTTSKQIQTNYRNIFNYLTPSQCIINTIKTQLQNTQVSKGLIFQTSQTYSSPIQYDQLIQSFDRQLSLQEGLGPYIQENILMDEILQQFQIQYPTFTEVLAQVNSIAFIVVFSRIMGRFFSKKLIYEDIFMVILTKLFQDKNQQILKHNNLIEQKNDFYLRSLNIQNNEIEDNLEQDCSPSPIVPNFKTKFRDYVEKSQILETKNHQNSTDFQNIITIQQDEINQQKCNDVINSKDYQQNFQFNDSSQEIVLNMYNSIKKKDEINEKQIECSQNSNKAIKDRQLFCQEDLIKQINQKKLNKQEINLSLQTSQRQDQSSPLSNQNKQSFQKISSPIRNQFNSKILTEKNKSSNLPQVRQAFTEFVSTRMEATESGKLKKAIRNLIFKFRIFKSKKYLSSKKVDSQSVKNIHKEAQKSMDIYQMCEDIIFLKKSVSMLLSQEQLSAIQFVSLTENYLNLDLNSSDFDIQYKRIEGKLNHFEKQFLTLQSQKLQVENINKFIKKLTEQEKNNELDKRIITSILKSE